MEGLGSTLGGAPGASQHGLGVFESFGDEQPARMPPAPAGGGSRASKPGKNRKNGGGGGDGDDDSGYTTIMLRNIPNKYTRQMLIDQLHRGGFQGDIDYLYLPTDFANRCNVGYCFCNLRTAAARRRFVTSFDGVAAQSCLPGFNSYKVCQVTKAKWQGREENVRRLRSSPELMAQLAQHPEWLPLLLTDTGEQEPFLCDEGDSPPLGRGVAGAKRQAKAKSRPSAGVPGMYPGGAQVGADEWSGMPPASAGLFGGPGQGRGRGGCGGGGRGGRRGCGGVGGMSPYMDGVPGPYAVPMIPGMPIMTDQGVQYMPYEGGFGGPNYFMQYPSGAGGGGFAAYPGMGGYPGPGGWWGGAGGPGVGPEAYGGGGGGRSGRGAGRGGKRPGRGGRGSFAGDMAAFGVEGYGDEDGM